jgi:hypothetical protein
MEHNIDGSHRSQHRVRVANVTFDKLRIRGQVRAIPTAEVVEDADAIPTREQSRDDVRADEASAARD